MCDRLELVILVKEDNFHVLNQFIFPWLPQTLLHEMIHALLFVTQNNRDRDGHGPEFCKHMNRINKASGTKITVSVCS